MESGEVNLGDSNGEVTGGIYHGVVFRGQGHLTVKGNVLGDSRGRFEIEMSETLVLEQSAKHVALRARHIVVLGDFADFECHSDIGMEVRGNLDETSVPLG